MSDRHILLLYHNRTPEAEILLAPFTSRFTFHYAPRGDDLEHLLPEAEIVFGGLSEDRFNRTQKLKWVQHHATGVDNMLYPAFLKSPVLLTSIAGALTTVVAEHAMALILALSRHLHHHRDQQSRREWKIHPGLELENNTLGILGFGRTGGAIGRRAAAFGLRIRAVDAVARDAPEYVESLRGIEELDALLVWSRFLICTLPLTPDTRHLLNAARIARLPEGAFFINVGRGGTVDESALLDALRSSRLAGAALDVTETEPYPAEGPLWDAPNLILTSHSAGWSGRMTERKLLSFTANLERYLSGRPLEGLVDKSRGC